MTAMDGIILAGGRARRMGGAPKPMLEIAGRTLLERTADAARTAGCAQLIVAGPRRDVPLEVRWVLEEPPFGGPVAGLAAALPFVTTEWVLVLPADLARPEDAVPALTSAPRAGDGLCLVDEGGTRQWLTAILRTDALRRRIEGLDAGAHGASARSVFAVLDLADASAPDGAADDIDTWDHLHDARRRAGVEEKENIMAEDSSRTLPPEALDAWATALRVRFGLSEGDLPVAVILDLARDVANDVARPAAPFSAFVAGLVAGRAGGSPEQVREVVAEIARLAGEWPAR